MFRRRRVRRGLVSRMVGEPVPPQLIEANRRFEMGDYAVAAGQYEQLADAAARRPRIAAHLLIQAGRARLLAGQTQPAVALFRRGLGILAEHRRWLALRRQADRVVQFLRERGDTLHADEIAAWLRGQPVPAQEQPPQPASGPSSSKPPRLPLHCPSCGGPVDPRDVEWVDQVTVECNYCGGMIRAEEG